MSNVSRQVERKKEATWRVPRTLIFRAGTIACEHWESLLLEGAQILTVPADDGVMLSVPALEGMMLDVLSLRDWLPAVFS